MKIQIIASSTGIFSAIVHLLLSVGGASSFSVSKNDIAKAAAAGAIAFSVVTTNTILLPPQPTFAATTTTTAVAVGEVDKGETIFNGNCAACHAGGQNVIMPEKTLEKEALDSFLGGGRNEKAVVNQVTNGKNAMPAFGGRLSDDDIANVAAFVIRSSENGWE